MSAFDEIIKGIKEAIDYVKGDKSKAKSKLIKAAEYLEENNISYVSQ
jgi:hypothetical protein